MCDVLQKADLFNRNSINHTNYTIRYKYVDNLFGGAIFFAQINITGAHNSTSEVDYLKEIYTDRKHFVDATIDVINATNFTSSVEVRGFVGINIDGISLQLLPEQVKPHSYALICTQNVAKEKLQQKPLIELGNRMPKDILIQYRQEYSNNRTFSLYFHDQYVNITYILVKVNSPWVIVFTNKIIATKNYFQATVYELKRNNFQVEMFIFGTKKEQT
ncbi:uncharacterized protein LOC116350646 isoform X2 [Contarinia nasturtii]|uniref:uncharacterized protein LOC116350646 isoform X2 n=1 Tax=Contarinia nasturtii TaxID=265458 RepID=UPI0012D4C19B|nr:uncharacterized protein LOC116350646 isoform X2 [Contarinia nasturtii]